LQYIFYQEGKYFHRFTKHIGKIIQSRPENTKVLNQFINFCGELISGNRLYNKEVEKEVLDFYVYKRPQDLGKVLRRLVAFFENASNWQHRVEFVLMATNLVRDRRAMQSSLPGPKKPEKPKNQIDQPDFALLWKRVLWLLKIEEFTAYQENSHRKIDLAQLITNLMFIAADLAAEKLAPEATTTPGLKPLRGPQKGKPAHASVPGKLYVPISNARKVRYSRMVR
jgi:hypothetical protein